MLTMARPLLQIGLFMMSLLYLSSSVTAQYAETIRFGARSGFFLGEPCGPPNNQKCLPKRSQCKNDMCDCKDNYERSGNDHCIAKAGSVTATSECSTDSDCQNLPDAGCALTAGSDDGFCFCKYGPLGTGGTLCQKQGNCTAQTGACTAEQECVAGTCRCLNNGVLHNGTCADSSSSMACNGMSLPCPSVAAVNGFSVCSGGSCQCFTINGVPGKYSSVNNTLSCTEKGYFDACTFPSECPGNRGLTCINGRCNCFPYHRPNSTAPITERNCVHAVNTCCRSSAVCGDPDLFTPPFNLTCTEGTCVMNIPGITVPQVPCVPV